MSDKRLDQFTVTERLSRIEDSLDCVNSKTYSLWSEDADNKKKIRDLIEESHRFHLLLSELIRDRKGFRRRIKTVENYLCMEDEQDE